MADEKSPSLKSVIRALDDLETSVRNWKPSGADKHVQDCVVQFTSGMKMCTDALCRLLAGGEHEALDAIFHSTRNR